MNLIEVVIEKRNIIMDMFTVRHGVVKLMLFGSVLDRKEHEQSVIKFLAVYDPNVKDDPFANYKLENELSLVFNRKVLVVDNRRISEEERPQIDIDPVDIMLLDSTANYKTTPKSSRVYFYMLNKLFRDYDYDIDATSSANAFYASLADGISRWFSKLLRAQDNDLKVYEGFDFTEVLFICDNIERVLLHDLLKEKDRKRLLNDYIHRLKGQLPAIKEYVAARHSQFSELRTKE
ncbi:hypothetical protein P4H66_30545 [Paenibacillus dokdonensis]|uniref:Polymerase beta nucleotidyltransferase domain-containing protein n=1 Tax=Paenibacillus dokdonensis TaxID=2567944 RepID=A0ABU6GWS4_9BACL|nr:hypothetical protein [Paenibacillus dokdonensis]MEC0244156.1 hypothetical protein [Paenibacillus dokdonensis]